MGFYIYKSRIYPLDEGKLLWYIKMLMKDLIVFLPLTFMALTVQQQIYELLKKSNSILIVPNKNLDGDAVGSALALALILEKMGKKYEIACSETPSEKLSFLPKIGRFKTDIETGKDFMISINIKENPIEEIRYETVSDHLNIYISASKKQLDKEKVTFKNSGAEYDLIITLDSPDLETLGAFYSKNPEIFFDTPIINIDHHPSNENFGKINLVNIVASSTAEILMNFIYSADKRLLDEKIATCLLTGIINDTGSFQTSNTTPSTFVCAANLIAQGANQSLIVQHLYKTKPISVLQLLGRTMASLKVDENLKVGWKIMDRKDFWKTKATIKDLDYVIEELSHNAGDLAVILLLWEKEQSTWGKLYFPKEDTRLAPLAEVLKKTLPPSPSAKENNITDFVCHGQNAFKTRRVILDKIKKLLEIPGSEKSSIL